MHEEIFGPICRSSRQAVEDAIAYVNAHPRPLALYYFGHGRAAINRVLAETTSGGVSINETMLTSPRKTSRSAASGRAAWAPTTRAKGSTRCTKPKPVFYQARVNGAALIRPPYGKTLDLALRFLAKK